MTIYILIIVAYLLGSVPFGLLIARSKGIDLRKVGSGNIGATNVGRALGGKWAKICFFLDLLKGVIPMLLAGSIIGKTPTQPQIWLWLLCGTAAILGHIFPIYLRFKGGKGVATSLGMVLGLWPYFTIAGLVCFVVWVVCLYKWKYVSLGSIVGAALFPIIVATQITLIESWSFAKLWPLLFIAIVLGSLVIIRHRDNIKRLIEGTEKKAIK